MAIAMRGLRIKPKYEELIGVAVSHNLYNIKLPNRDAKFLREGFVLSQLDGEGARQMERQQEMASKESYKEHLLKEIAKNTGANIHDLRNDSHQDRRTERINNAVHFNNMTQGDEDIGDDMEGGTQTNESGVQARTQTNESGVQANAQTSSSGVQAQAQTSPSGVQTERPNKTFEAGAQTYPRVNTKGTQATEDKPEEI